MGWLPLHQQAWFALLCWGQLPIGGCAITNTVVKDVDEFRTESPRSNQSRQAIGNFRVCTHPNVSTSRSRLAATLPRACEYCSNRGRVFYRDGWDRSVRSEPLQRDLQTRWRETFQPIRTICGSLFDHRGETPAPCGDTPNHANPGPGLLR